MSAELAGQSRRWRSFLPEHPKQLDVNTGFSLVAGSLALGLLGDALFYNASPGINVPVWVAALIAVFVWTSRKTGHPLQRDQVFLLGLAMACAATVAWRGASTLQELSLWASASCLMLAVAAKPRAGFRRLSLLELGVAGVSAITASIIALPSAVSDGAWTQRLSGSSRRGVIGAGRVLLLTTPIVLCFGGLFIAADAVFESQARRLLVVDVGEPTLHFAWILGTAWVACGVLWAGLVTPAGDHEVELADARRLRTIEVTAVLASLIILFVAFLVIQARYLFGGEALVVGQTGLTYAEYARRGFFELVTVSAILLPLLLGLDWALKRTRLNQLLFRGMAAVLVLLSFGVMVAAVERFRVYESAFGLTETRIYAVAILFWLGAVFIWFGWTVLRGRRREFAAGAILSAVAAVLILNALSPDAVIARRNTDRAMDTKRFDAVHASRLGPEAVPILITRLDTLSPEDACIVARGLTQRWSGDEGDFRSWNYARGEAHRAVAENRDALAAACPAGRDP